MKNSYTLLLLFVIVPSIFSPIANGDNMLLSFNYPARNNGGNYSLLLPDKLIFPDGQVKIEQEGRNVEAKVYISSFWPSGHVRKLTFWLENPATESQSQTIILRFTKSERKTPIYFGDTSTSTLLNHSSDWLKYIFLLQNLEPLKNLSEFNNEKRHTDMDWYSGAMILEAEFIINQTLLDEKGYPPELSSQWLYDRPRSLFQLYFLTGLSKYLIAAVDAANFYMRNINEQGMFKLETKDPKFLMATGLYYHYLINGDQNAVKTLERMLKASAMWDPYYTRSRNFWTERHQAAALEVALANWLLKGSNETHKRIDEIIDTTFDMTFNRSEHPLKTCPAHSLSSHEGKGGDSLVCSPWMMALLTDPLWKYWLKTKDDNAAALILGFADFVSENGFYETELGARRALLPYYLVNLSDTNLSMKNKWTDGQHACDISGMLGKATFIAKYLKNDYSKIKRAFENMIDECRFISQKIIATNTKQGYAPVMPPRKFGWKYSTTAELAYLEALFRSNE